MLKLQLGRLKHDTGFHMPVNLIASCDPASYGFKELILKESLRFSGYAENIDGEIEIRGQLSATILYYCSRCGKSFASKYNLPFEEIYSNLDIVLDQASERDKHIYNGATIDFTPEALRSLFELIPMKPLCRDDCKGLCAECGIDLNIQQCSCSENFPDPRWEKLRVMIEAGKGV